MREFNHVGIVTDQKHAGETFVPDCRAYITDFNSHPYRIEWCRIEAGSTLPEVLKKGLHLAFKVDDLDQEIAGKNVVLPPFSPMEGVRAAFIMSDDGVPIELMQFS